MRIFTKMSSATLLCALAFGAQITRAADGASAAKAAAKTEPAAAKAEPAKPKDAPSGFSRWFELQAASLGLRYRSTDDDSGTTTFDGMQHKENVKARFKFDAEGKYSVNAGLASGNSFTGSWNNTGVGTGSPFTNVYLKQLYFAAKPVRGVELQYGGLGFLRGEGTEITTYDEDGYIVGQRVTVKRPENLFFDEVSVTYGYLGDLTKPSVTKRFGRLDESNYHQFLVSKKAGKRAVVSADYTMQSGVETLRQAVSVKVGELRVVDSVRFENYQRVDVKPDYGFAVTAEKAVVERVTVAAGYASIDPNYGGLNADRFNKGNRVFAGGNVTITPELSVSLFAQRAVGNDVFISNRSRFDAILNFNVLKAFQRAGLF
jgi:hypothetical protein